MARQEVPSGGRGNGRVLLIRHGPVAPLWRGKLYGRSDAEALSLEGVTWTGPVPDIVASSDLSRAHYTAESLFPERDVRLLPGLRETDYGELDGRDLVELHAEHPTLWDQWLADPDHFRFPGGETYSEVTARVVAAVEQARLLAPDGTVAIVTHGGCIRSVVAWILGATAHGVGRLRCSPLHYVEVRYWDGVPVVERTNASGTVQA